MSKKSKLAMVAILVIAFVLRPAVAQMGPILQIIQTGLSIDSSQVALLTAVPVLCFGFGAFASPAIVRRFGVNHSMVYLLAILVAAIAVRPYLGYYGLLLATTIAGLSIAVANVLLPTIVRERFSKNIVFVTSAYTTILAASASFAAAISYPSACSWGWQFALAIWALPSLLAFGLSLSLLKGHHEAKVEVEHRDHSELWQLVFRSPITWWVMALFGIQSLGFYALLGWLPSIGIGNGLDPAAAGGLLGLMTIIGVPVRFAIASNIGKLLSLSVEGVIISGITAVGLTLLLMHLWIPAVVLIGIGQASSFPLSLSLISTRAGNSELTTILSSVVQGVGYLLAAAGTYFVGILGNQTGNWNFSIALLLAVTLIQVVASWFAGLDRQIK